MQNMALPASSQDTELSSQSFSTESDMKVTNIESPVESIPVSNLPFTDDILALESNDSGSAVPFTIKDSTRKSLLD